MFIVEFQKKTLDNKLEIHFSEPHKTFEEADKCAREQDYKWDYFVISGTTEEDERIAQCNQCTHSGKDCKTCKYKGRE